GCGGGGKRGDGGEGRGNKKSFWGRGAGEALPGAPPHHPPPVTLHLLAANVQQVSFKVQNLDDVRAFYHRLQQEGLRIDRTVIHGIACSVYFYDPEDNRVELYYT